MLGGSRVRMARAWLSSGHARRSALGVGAVRILAAGGGGDFAVALEDGGRNAYEVQEGGNYAVSNPVTFLPTIKNSGNAANQFRIVVEAPKGLLPGCGQIVTIQPGAIASSGDQDPKQRPYHIADCPDSGTYQVHLQAWQSGGWATVSTISFVLGINPTPSGYLRLHPPDLEVIGVGVVGGGFVGISPTGPPGTLNAPDAYRLRIRVRNNDSQGRQFWGIAVAQNRNYVTGNANVQGDQEAQYGSQSLAYVGAGMEAEVEVPVAQNGVMTEDGYVTVFIRNQADASVGPNEGMVRVNVSGSVVKAVAKSVDARWPTKAHDAPAVVVKDGQQVAARVTLLPEKGNNSVNVEVRNDGSAQGELWAEVIADGKSLGRQELVLDPGEAKGAAFYPVLPASGSVQVQCQFGHGDKADQIINFTIDTATPGGPPPPSDGSPPPPSSGGEGKKGPLGVPLGPLRAYVYGKIGL